MMSQFRIGFSFFGFGDAILFEVVPGPYRSNVQKNEAGEVVAWNESPGPKHLHLRDMSKIYGNQYFIDYHGHETVYEQRQNRAAEKQRAQREAEADRTFEALLDQKKPARKRARRTDRVSD
jgi:hypothetical protein